MSWTWTDDIARSLLAQEVIDPGTAERLLRRPVALRIVPITASEDGGEEEPEGERRAA